MSRGYSGRFDAGLSRSGRHREMLMPVGFHAGLPTVALSEEGGEILRGGDPGGTAGLESLPTRLSEPLGKGLAGACGTGSKLRVLAFLDDDVYPLRHVS